MNWWLGGLPLTWNLTWKNQVSKNIGDLHRASHLLDFKNLFKIYFFFIHVYINYANIAWVTAFKTKLQGIPKKAKHAAEIISHENRYDHFRTLLKMMKALNVFKST